MGFEESGHSSIKSNEKLRKRLRKNFFPKTFASPSYHQVPDHQVQEASEALNTRIQLANKSRARSIRREYLFYILVIVVGMLGLIILFGN